MGGIIVVTDVFPVVLESRMTYELVVESPMNVRKDWLLRVAPRREQLAALSQPGYSVLRRLPEMKMVKVSAEMGGLCVGKCVGRKRCASRNKNGDTEKAWCISVCVFQFRKFETTRNGSL